MKDETVNNANLCWFTVKGRRSCILILLSKHHFLCKEVKAERHIFIFLQFNSDLQEPNPECANNPTCSVDPGPVAIQLSLNLLLAPQLHESPAVLHPLPFLSKLPKAAIQMTKIISFWEQNENLGAHCTRNFSWRHDNRKVWLFLIHSSIGAEKRRDEKRGDGGLVSHSRDNENRSPISLKN